MSRYMKNCFHLACYMKSSTGLDNYCVFFLGWVKKKYIIFMQKPVKLFFPQEKIMYFLCVSKWKQTLSKEKKIQIVFPDLYWKGEKNTMF